jgi:glycosyltransferase involved in cell wall biosynthesis
LVIEKNEFCNLKKIAIIGSAGIPPRYGGFETLVQNLVLELNTRFSFIVYCSRRLYNKQERRKGDKYAELVYIPLRSNGFQSIIYDLSAMIHAAGNADILLILGISGCIFLPVLRMLSGKKIITHVDGLEWKRDKWNPFVRIYLKVSELLAVKYSHKIIADNIAIKEYIKNEYGFEPELVEYGGEHSAVVAGSADFMNSFKDLTYPYALTVSRIEPENNIHAILNAFSRIPSKRIVVAGNWNNNRYSRRLYKKYISYPNILLYNSIYKQDLLNLLRSGCEVYIHGNSAGGTNPSLVEAMFAGKPVIAYDVIYNRITTMEKAIYFKGEEELVKILKEVDKTGLNENGINMEKIARERYKWKDVAEKYAGLFV